MVAQALLFGGYSIPDTVIRIEGLRSLKIAFTWSYQKFILYDWGFLAFRHIGIITIQLLITILKSLISHIAVYFEPFEN